MGRQTAFAIRPLPGALWGGLLALFAAAPALADDSHPQLATTWNNTVTSTVAQRLGDGAIGVGYGYPGGAGSAVAYDRGAYTPLRLDWLSEFDMDYGAVGLHASAAARVERALVSASANSNGVVCHQPQPNAFDLAEAVCPGGLVAAEIRELYLHGSTAVGKDQTVTVRLGRQTVIWGQSLYFPGNGIAAGQAPIDTSMVEKISGYTGEIVFLPVGQVSASWRLGANWTIEAYDQFEWRESRIGSVGDFVSAAAAGVATPPGGGTAYFALGGSTTPNSTDQYGLAVKWTHGDTDYGLYALSFDAKIPTLQLHPASGLAAGPLGPLIGTYSEEFPTGIQIYGVSMAGPLGAASYGAELSARHNMPLLTGPIRYPGHFEYPTGDTLHAQFSWTTMTPPLPWVPDGAKWTGEIAANSLLSVTQNAGLRTLDRTRNAAALRTVFEPQFLQAQPHLDLSLPIGLGFTLFGLSSVDPQMNRGTGDISIGLVAKYQDTWTAALTLTHYFGKAKNLFPYTFVPAGQPLANADFIALSVQRGF